MASNPEAEKLKNLGNESLKNSEFDMAVDFYTQAIGLCPDNYLYYSNRSGAYASLKKYKESYKDAQKIIELNPSWPKGYSRLGTALEYLGKDDEALAAYNKGLAVDSNNEQLKSAVSKLSLKSASMKDPTDFLNDPQMKDLFSNPDYLKSPQMKNLFSNPDFIKSMGEYGKNPEGFMNDPKIKEMFKNMPPPPKTSSKSPGSANSAKPREEPKVEKKAETTPQSAENLAESEKEIGNQCYKKRDFETAISHYNKAKELNPKTILYDLNIAAVFYEQGKYEECIKICEDAIETGRQSAQPYKTIARAYSRIGNAYAKLEKYSEALTAYNKSLSEFRDIDVVRRARDIEATIKERDRKAYINPTIGEEEKAAGNKLFASGHFPEAIPHYTEAIKRNPTDPRNYSNRAACYTKLMDYTSCIRDCDECLKLDPTFVKGYLRKANALLMLKDSYQARMVYEKALEYDSNNEEVLAGLRKCYDLQKEMNPEQTAQNAMNDPEVKEILSDPAMKVILDTMTKDPSAAAQYFKDPIIYKKITKLIDAGIVKVA